MMNFTELASAPSERPVPFTDQLRLAVAAYLACFKGSCREHAESDLRSFLTWCAERGMDPLAARRPHLELYIQWMQEVRRFKPSTVSRRFSVTAGFYRTCVTDGVLEHSPAEYVRRPAVPAESPTLGARPPAVRSPAHRRPAIRPSLRLRPRGHARAARLADLRGHRRRHPRPKRRTWSPGVARVRKGHQSRLGEGSRCGGGHRSHPGTGPACRARAAGQDQVDAVLGGRHGGNRGLPEALLLTSKHCGWG